MARRTILNAEDLAIEEEQRVEGLVLGGRRDTVTNSECRQEGRDLRGPHLGRMALAMEEDVTLDPMDVWLLSPPAVVACANGETDAVEELAPLPFVDEMPSGPGPSAATSH